MSRTRMFGTLAAVVASAGLVAGCGGGGGHTAAAPTPTTPAPAAAAPAAAATPVAPGPLGAFAQADPVTGRDETFSSFTRFPKTRAGKIFVDPNAKPPEPAIPAVIPGGGAVTSIPVNPAQPSGAAATAVATPAAVTTQLSASLDISGVVQTVVVGDAVPAAAPQFTVQAITATMVTLKPNSGSLPGGSTTLDLAVGKAVTLSNPSTKTNLVINVVEIKSQV